MWWGKFSPKLRRPEICVLFENMSVKYKRTSTYVLGGVPAECWVSRLQWQTLQMWWENHLRLRKCFFASCAVVPHSAPFLHFSRTLMHLIPKEYTLACFRALERITVMSHVLFVLHMTSKWLQEGCFCLVGWAPQSKLCLWCVSVCGCASVRWLCTILFTI